VICRLSTDGNTGPGKVSACAPPSAMTSPSPYTLITGNRVRISDANVKPPT
jgi:hypothetical protein